MSSQRRGLCYHYAPRAASKQRLNGVLVHWCGAAVAASLLCVPCRRPARRRAGGVKFIIDDDDDGAMICRNVLLFAVRLIYSFTPRCL